MTAALLLQLFFFTFVSAFVHPGLLVTDADIRRIQAKLNSQQDPWLSSWNDLISLEYSSASYTNNAVPVVYRDNEGTNTANAELLWHDAAAAFNLALRWKVSGDTQYAEAAAKILTAWGETLTSLGGSDDDYLTAGMQGHELANAAELLRDYTPFAESGLTALKDMMSTVFLAKNLYFLNHRDGSEHNVKHFFANWELSQLASAIAIAVLTDNQTVFDFAVDYFKNGTGNGAIGNAITNIVSEPSTGKPLGQGQESGRDQGHSGLDFQMLGVIGQQAYNQGEDLYAYDNNRILLGAEYYARYNLGNDVPFEFYTNGIVSFTEISNASRGAFRPTWELLYSHYGMLKGLDVTWTEQYRNYTLERFGHGYEGGAGSWGEGSGHYDGLGWGTLLYRLDESDIAAALNESTSISAATSMSTSRPVSSSSNFAISSIVIGSDSASPVSASTASVSLTLSNISVAPTTFATSTTSATTKASTISTYSTSSAESAIPIIYEVVYVC